jgi:transcriptional regulator with XRE-family HTH domain
VSPDPVLAIFGSRVAHHRKALGWSLRDLGREAGGLSPNTTWRVEHGIGNGVSLSVAARIAAALRVPLGELALPPACRQCWDCPPPGFTCNKCGKLS